MAAGQRRSMKHTKAPPTLRCIISISNLDVPLRDDEKMMCCTKEKKKRASEWRSSESQRVEWSYFARLVHVFTYQRVPSLLTCNVSKITCKRDLSNQ